jgi:hypothetical protein
LGLLIQTFISSYMTSRYLIIAARVPVVVPEHSIGSSYVRPLQAPIGHSASQCCVVMFLCSSYTCSPTNWRAGPADSGPNGLHWKNVSRASAARTGPVHVSHSASQSRCRGKRLHRIIMSGYGSAQVVFAKMSPPLALASTSAAAYVQSTHVRTLAVTFRYAKYSRTSSGTSGATPKMMWPPYPVFRRLPTKRSYTLRS